MSRAPGLMLDAHDYAASGHLAIHGPGDSTCAVATGVADLFQQQACVSATSRDSATVLLPTSTGERDGSARLPAATSRPPGGGVPVPAGVSGPKPINPALAAVLQALVSTYGWQAVSDTLSVMPEAGTFHSKSSQQQQAAALLRAQQQATEQLRLLAVKRQHHQQQISALQLQQQQTMAALRQQHSLTDEAQNSGPLPAAEQPSLASSFTTSPPPVNASPPHQHPPADPHPRASVPTVLVSARHIPPLPPHSTSPSTATPSHTPHHRMNPHASQPPLHTHNNNNNPTTAHHAHKEAERRESPAAAVAAPQHQQSRRLAAPTHPHHLTPAAHPAPTPVPAPQRSSPPGTVGMQVPGSDAAWRGPPAQGSQPHAAGRPIPLILAPRPIPWPSQPPALGLGLGLGLGPVGSHARGPAPLVPVPPHHTTLHPTLPTTDPSSGRHASGQQHVAPHRSIAPNVSTHHAHPQHAETPPFSAMTHGNHGHSRAAALPSPQQQQRQSPMPIEQQLQQQQIQLLQLQLALNEQDRLRQQQQHKRKREQRQHHQQRVTPARSQGTGHHTAHSQPDPPQQRQQQQQAASGARSALSQTAATSQSGAAAQRQTQGPSQCSSHVQAAAPNPSLHPVLQAWLQDGSSSTMPLPPAHSLVEEPTELMVRLVLASRSGGGAFRPAAARSTPAVSAPTAAAVASEGALNSSTRCYDMTGGGAAAAAAARRRSAPLLPAAAAGSEMQPLSDAAAAARLQQMQLRFAAQQQQAQLQRQQMQLQQQQQQKLQQAELQGQQQQQQDERQGQQRHRQPHNRSESEPQQQRQLGSEVGHRQQQQEQQQQRDILPTSSQGRYHHHLPAHHTSGPNPHDDDEQLADRTVHGGAARGFFSACGSSSSSTSGSRPPSSGRPASFPQQQHFPHSTTSLPVGGLERAGSSAPASLHRPAGGPNSHSQQPPQLHSASRPAVLFPG
ncbi:MAG: hypothetical protein WDW38_007676 [Sanguina aurantia]